MPILHGLWSILVWIRQGLPQWLCWWMHWNGHDLPKRTYFAEPITCRRCGVTKYWLDLFNGGAP